MAIKKRKAPVRFTATRQATFLGELGRTVNVAASARKAKVSETTVYATRAKSAEFRAAWETALREAYARLELMLLERAIKGVTKPVYYGGNKIGEITDYSDRQAADLLARHRAKQIGPACDAPESEEVLRARLAARFQAMGERLAANDDAA